MTDTYSRKPNSIGRICIKLAILVALMVGANFAGQELGERSVHRKITRLWNQYFASDQPNDAPPATNVDPFPTAPFSTDPFSVDPFSADPFSTDPFSASADPFSKDPFSGPFGGH